MFFKKVSALCIMMALNPICATAQEISSSIENIEISPSISTLDSSQATERGLTVHIYPSFLTYISDKRIPAPSHKKKRQTFDYDDVLISRFNTTSLLRQNGVDKLTTGILPPREGKWVATGYIEIIEDGFYFIYPIEDKIWTEENYKTQRGSKILSYVDSYNNALTKNGSSIKITLAGQEVFKTKYPNSGSNKQGATKIELKKGKYPIELIFSKVDYPHYSYPVKHPAINIVAKKIENIEQAIFYDNTAPANLYTFPLPVDNTTEAEISEPMRIIYLDKMNDIKESEKTAFTQVLDEKTRYLDAPENITFTMTPRVPGDYVFSFRVDPYPTLHENILYSCRITTSLNEIDYSVDFYRDPVDVETTYNTGGRVHIISITNEQVGRPQEISYSHSCKINRKDIEKYQFTPQLKTPSMNGFRSLEDFIINKTTDKSTNKEISEDELEFRGFTVDIFDPSRGGNYMNEPIFTQYFKRLHDVSQNDSLKQFNNMVHVASGYIKINEDDYYHIYPIENDLLPNIGSYILEGKSKSYVPILPLGASISIIVDNKKIFSHSYLRSQSNNDHRDHHKVSDYVDNFSSVYLQRGIYPISVNFSLVDYNKISDNGFAGAFVKTPKGEYSGVKIMILRGKNPGEEPLFSDIYNNKRRADIYTIKE